MTGGLLCNHVPSTLLGGTSDDGLGDDQMAESMYWGVCQGEHGNPPVRKLQQPQRQHPERQQPPAVEPNNVNKSGYKNDVPKSVPVDRPGCTRS